MERFICVTMQPALYSCHDGSMRALFAGVVVKATLITTFYGAPQRLVEKNKLSLTLGTSIVVEYILTPHRQTKLAAIRLLPAPSEYKRRNIAVLNTNAFTRFTYNKTSLSVKFICYQI